MGLLDVETSQAYILGAVEVNDVIRVFAGHKRVLKEVFVRQSWHRSYGPSSKCHSRSSEYHRRVCAQLAQPRREALAQAEESARHNGSPTDTL